MKDESTRSMEKELIFDENKDTLFKKILFFIWQILYPLKQSIYRLRWQHHADSRKLDWDWKKINFNRIALVNLLINRFKEPTYLEIGCFKNDLFDSVPVSEKVGVDPLRGGNIRDTSDSFFEKNKNKFDVIYIDGLHTYQQVREDIINSIKSINEGGWIALHDMLPRNWVEQHIPIVSGGLWTGDVWKVAFELIETDGIEFKILKIDHGVGVIKVINRDAILKDLSDKLRKADFSFYYDNLSSLPIVEWENAQDWLRS